MGDESEIRMTLSAQHAVSDDKTSKSNRRREIQIHLGPVQTRRLQFKAHTLRLVVLLRETYLH